MPDKPMAGLLTAIAIAPLCLVCALGPAAFVAAGGWLLAWLTGFRFPLAAVSVLAVGSWVAWCAVQRRSALHDTAKQETSSGVAGIERAR